MKKSKNSVEPLTTEESYSPDTRSGTGEVSQVLTLMQHMDIRWEVIDILSEHHVMLVSICPDDWEYTKSIALYLNAFLENWALILFPYERSTGLFGLEEVLRQQSRQLKSTMPDLSDVLLK